MPHKEERKEIFEIHLRKRNRLPENFDIDALAECAEGFSGSEIEQAVLDSMYNAYSRDKDIDQDLVLEALTVTVPLSRTMKERLDADREWAKTRARFASSLEKAAVEKEAREGSLSSGPDRIRWRITD